MPVTFGVVAHDAVPLQRKFNSADDIARSATESSEWSFGRNESLRNELLQSSVNPSEYPAVNPSPNGFVHTIVEAWGQHRNLVIRPDDVWMAILTQFHFYVNANAEKLRKSFVAHEGKKKLVVYVEASSRYAVDFGSFARQMSTLLHENVVDKDLVRWVLPDFSTTTLTDKTVCAVLLMATLKAYFDYGCGITCGIPQVTLAGEKKDWVDILSRLSKLAEFGDEPLAWSHLLRTIITRFISAFDNPTAKANSDFWRRVAYVHEPYCGMTYLSGWITAFCVWNNEGKWVGPNLAELLKGGIDEPLHPVPERLREIPKRLVLDGRPFNFTNFDAIPPGYAVVDVEVDDHGEKFKCEMTAGHIGCHVLPQGEVGRDGLSHGQISLEVEGKQKRRSSKLFSAGVKLLRSVSRSTKVSSSSTPVPALQTNASLVDTATPTSSTKAQTLGRGDSDELGFGDTIQPASAWFIYIKNK